ncbi:MAG: hypothetical protein R3E01_35320 [Pirellulaceae bacterium]|nr:hypothetical protein [Planctomycetales bacterium]
MSTFFNSVMSLPVPFNMVVLIVMIVVGASVISAVAKEIRRYFCHQSELEFKRELIDQGLNGAEIERIVRASSHLASGRSEDAPGRAHSVR